MPVVKIVISGTLYGQLVQNRLHMIGESFQNVAEVAAHIKNSWLNTVKLWQTSSLRYTSIAVSELTEGVTQQHVEVINVLGGQSPENQSTSFACAVLKFQTGLAGRKFRGRYYAAAPRMGATEFGQFHVDEFNRWKVQIDILKGLFTGPEGGSTGLGLIIRGSAPFHDTRVTDIALRPTLGVQRRRNIGVGA